jgi:hypothetical protein
MKWVLASALGSVAVIAASQAWAGGITVAPFGFAARGLGSFEPGGGPPVEARWQKVEGDWQLSLTKSVPTTEVAAAGAQINGVRGLSTTGLTIGFTLEPGSYCGAGAPRFNVRLSDGTIVFLGCIYGNDGSGNVSFSAGNTYGGVPFPSGATIEGLSIVQDETGTAVIDDIFVGSEMVGGPNENGSN